MTRLALPHLPGVLTAAEVTASAATIAALQRPDGMIPWYPGGHCDPWNHVETAMALTVAGRFEAAERAYGWLETSQRPDGSWHNYYLPDGTLEDAKLDTNVCAYIATGVWHHWLATGDRAFVRRFFPVVERALDWVLTLQTPRGEIIWARHVDGTPWSYALLTGSSSICHALRCGVALAGIATEDLGGDGRPDWELAAVTLADVIRTQPNAFEPKHRWAMDWYYPTLCGAVTGRQAHLQLTARWDEFVMDGLGVRCVNNEPWVTAAETAECAMAHAVAGREEQATELLRWTRAHRDADGAYWTGLVHPGAVQFPDGERSAYTAAAIILAADLLDGSTPTSAIFRADGLPPVTP